MALGLPLKRIIKGFLADNRCCRLEFLVEGCPQKAFIHVIQEYFPKWHRALIFRKAVLTFEAKELSQPDGSLRMIGYSRTKTHKNVCTVLLGDPRQDGVDIDQRDILQEHKPGVFTLLNNAAYCGEFIRDPATNGKSYGKYMFVGPVIATIYITRDMYMDLITKHIPPGYLSSHMDAFGGAPVTDYNEIPFKTYFKNGRGTDSDQYLVGDGRYKNTIQFAATVYAVAMSCKDAVR